MNSAPFVTAQPLPLGPEAFDEVDAILDDLRTRYDETPQWEFCEGFMAALVCCRREIPPAEYFAELLAVDDVAHESASAAEGSFADAAQKDRFMQLWTQRWQEVVTALNAKVDALDDDAAYHPEVMDVRGAIAALPEAERADVGDEALPSFGQVWALGFMFAVETWPEERSAPKDKEAAKWLDEGLQAIVALTEDDTGEPTLSVFSDDGPPQSAKSGWKPSPRPFGRCMTCANCGATWGRGWRRFANSRARPQRPVPLRQRQEIQEVPRGLKRSPKRDGQTG